MGVATELQCSTHPTWTNAPGPNETLPLSCLPWHLAFAFCAWDGGRLPTEAEWNYAAAGGNEQRDFPWGATAPDASHAVFECNGDGSAAGECTSADILSVGSRSPLGDGKSWGDGAPADLAGSMWEWTLDSANFTDCCGAPYAQTQCDDCAHLSPSALRVLRGGCFTSVSPYLGTPVRYSGTPGGPCLGMGGARCARTP
jgi:formylglycine-generating enzyme required for sulfatase activity